MSLGGVAGGVAAGYVLYKGHNSLQKQMKGGNAQMPKKRKTTRKKTTKRRTKRKKRR